MIKIRTEMPVMTDEPALLVLDTCLGPISSAAYDLRWAAGGQTHPLAGSAVRSADDVVKAIGVSGISKSQFPEIPPLRHRVMRHAGAAAG